MQMHAFLILMHLLCLANEHAKFRSSHLPPFKSMQIAHMYCVLSKSRETVINPKALAISSLYYNSVWVFISSHKSFVSHDPRVRPPAAGCGNKTYQFRVISAVSPSSVFFYESYQRQVRHHRHKNQTMQKTQMRKAWQRKRINASVLHPNMNFYSFSICGLLNHTTNTSGVYSRS